MSLRWIYGKAGSGKSEFCFQEIAKKIKQNKKIYMITPEQFSFTAEKKLMEACEGRAIFGAEVITFQRMVYRVKNEVGGFPTKELTKAGKAMLLYHILNQKKSKLTFLGKSEENVDLIATTITEFKKHGISLPFVQEQVEKIQDPYLQLKWKDIQILYEGFEKAVCDQYLDETDGLQLLADKIEEVSGFKDAYFYLDEFSGFTYAEYQIIEKLLKIGKQVSITVTTDSLAQSDHPDTDIFYDNKQMIQKINQIKEEVKQMQGKQEEQEDVFLEQGVRFQAKELKHIEENLYQVPYQKQFEKPSNLSLFLASDPYHEVEQVAKQITTLVREEKYRFRDIAVITKDVEQYSSLVKAIFASYQIPTFIDEKKELGQNVLIQYLLAMIDVFRRNWSYEAVFSYLKTGFVSLDTDEIFQLEQYCIHYGIKGNRWYRSDWTYGKLNEESTKQVDRWNELRKQIVEPLLTFQEKVRQEKTGMQMTKALYEFLIENQVDQTLLKKAKQLEGMDFLEMAQEYASSWNIVIGLLDQVASIFEEEKLSFDLYFSLLKVGFGHSDLGRIPTTLDQVIVGDVDRSRSHQTKAIFILGMNDGVFPSVITSEGFLSDQDRQSLKEQGVELAKTTLEKVYENNFNIYKAFTTAEERLFLSYPSSDKEGKALRSSILINRIKKMFPSLEEKSDLVQLPSQMITKQTTFEELLKQIIRLAQQEEIDPIWYDVFAYYQEDVIWKEVLAKSLQGLNYTNEPEHIKPESMQRLYGEVLKTSVSRLEQYRSCPFSFYLKYGLRLQEKAEYQIQPMDTGSFMHEVIEAFFDWIKEQNKKINQLEQEEIKKIVDHLITEKLALPKNELFNSSAKFRVLTKRLKKIVYQSISYIVESLRQSEFEVAGNEVEFKQGKQYPPICLTLEDGKKVEITGKIDRIDVAQMPNGKYLRIIDYKSSVKNIDLSEVIAGIQIQLLTYLDATCKLEEILPAGVLYFNLTDPMISANRMLSEEELEKEIRKKFKMQGLVLADVAVLQKMDHKLETGASEIIPVYLDKEGKVSEAKSSVATKEQFEKLQYYVQKTIQEIAKEIFSGAIELKPYYQVKTKKTPCQYCAYRSICSFDRGFCQNEYRYIGGRQKQELWNQIQKEVGENEN